MNRYSLLPNFPVGNPRVEEAMGVDAVLLTSRAIVSSVQPVRTGQAHSEERKTERSLRPLRIYSHGRSGRIRTPDLRFWRPLLYQAEPHSCILLSNSR